jgi:molecular chaperone Hsp33
LIRTCCFYFKQGHGLSEVHKFLFEGLPVRGSVVRLTDAWVEILRRRAGNTSHGPYPKSVQNLLGEMTAAAVLMQSNIKFNGALVLQVFGDGPVKLAVVEVQSNFSLRATATVEAEVTDDATLKQMLNVGGKGRCAITLDPKDRLPGQQPYQGVVPLAADGQEELNRFSDVLQHYMLQSEQLDTTLVLAADDKVAAGLLIQRLPMSGSANLAGVASGVDEKHIGHNEDYNRIATLAASLKREELLTLDVDTMLRRLFWEESLVQFEPLHDATGPHFACNCSRERVAKMIHGLGNHEAQEVLLEQRQIEVGCDFCGAQYRFDPVDVAQIFMPKEAMPPTSDCSH